MWKDTVKTHFENCGSVYPGDFEKESPFGIVIQSSNSHIAYASLIADDIEKRFRTRMCLNRIPQR